MPKPNPLARRAGASLFFPLFALLVLIKPLAAYCQDEPKIPGAAAELSLSSAVEKVKAHLPRLRSEEFSVLLARADHQAARSNYLPRLGADLSATRGDDPVYVFSSLLKQQRFTADNFAIPSLNEPSSLTNYQAALEISLPLFTAFQNEGRLRSTEFALKAAQSGQALREQETVLLALSHYVNVAALDKTSSLIEEALAAAQTAVDEAEDLKEKGLVLGCDYLTAKAIYFNMKQLRERAVQQKNSAHASLNILMGTPQDSGYQFPLLSPAFPLPAVDETAFKKDSLALRQDKKALEYQLKSADAQLNQEKKSRLPTVDAFARQEDNTNKFTGSGDNYLVGLRVHMDLFDPALAANINRKKAERDRLNSQVEQIEDDLADAAQQAFAEYQTQNEILRYLQQSVSDAQGATNAITELYKTGKRTIADVLKARMFQLETESSYWNARYDSFLNYARLKFLSGRLDETSLPDLESMLASHEGGS